MEYRRLNVNDLVKYFENRLRALKNSPSAFLTTFDEEVSRGTDHFKKTLEHVGNDRVIFGALSNNEIIGTIGLFREERPKISHKAKIWGMYVDVKYRKAGVGKTLLDNAIKHAREKMKVSAIYLSVEAKNQAAKYLYETKGFKCWGTEPMAMSADGEFFDEDHMVLQLN